MKQILKCFACLINCFAICAAMDPPSHPYAIDTHTLSVISTPPALQVRPLEEQEIDSLSISCYYLTKEHVLRLYIGEPRLEWQPMGAELTIHLCLNSVNAQAALIHNAIISLLQTQLQRYAHTKFQQDLLPCLSFQNARRQARSDSKQERDAIRTFQRHAFQQITTYLPYTSFHSAWWNHPRVHGTEQHNAHIYLRSFIAHQQISMKQVQNRDDASKFFRRTKPLITLAHHEDGNNEHITFTVMLRTLHLSFDIVKENNTPPNPEMHSVIYQAYTSLLSVYCQKAFQRDFKLQFSAERVGDHFSIDELNFMSHACQSALHYFPETSIVNPILYQQPSKAPPIEDLLKTFLWNAKYSYSGWGANGCSLCNLAQTGTCTANCLADEDETP